MISKNIENYKNKIILFYRQNKRMPVYAEIMEMLGFRSKNAVYKLTQKLISQGFLEKDQGGHLLPKRLLDEIPVLGLVEAGFPTITEESQLDTMSLDDYLIKNKNQTYLLRVKGDSMIDAGINDGDLVIAEKTQTDGTISGREIKDGDIVIALVDGGSTMKYFRRKKGQVYLEPANKNYRPIYPEYELEITALVRGVVRKY